MGDDYKTTKKVEKHVTGRTGTSQTIITVDDNKQHKLLLGLGCLLTAAGAGLTGWAADKVNKCKCTPAVLCSGGSMPAINIRQPNQRPCLMQLQSSWW